MKAAPSRLAGAVKAAPASIFESETKMYTIYDEHGNIVAYATSERLATSWIINNCPGGSWTWESAL